MATQATGSGSRALRVRAHAGRRAARSSTSRNARDHSARSPQPRHETMFPSTTAAPSTYSPPAISMSGASGPKPELRRPRRRPSAAGTWGPWQSVPTGFSSREEVPDDARDLRVDPDELGRAAAGDDEGDVRVRIDVGEGDIDGARAPLALDVRVPVRLEVVDDELDRAHRRRGDVRLVPCLDEAVLDVHRLEVLGRITGQDQHLRHRLLQRSRVSRDRMRRSRPCAPQAPGSVAVARQVMPVGPQARAVTVSGPRRSVIRRSTANDPLGPGRSRRSSPGDAPLVHDRDAPECARHGCDRPRTRAR